MSLLNELKRRNVVRVAIAYLAFSWLLIQVTETLFPIYGLSDAAVRMVVTCLSIGFPAVLVLSWVFELTPEGLKFERDIPPSESATQHSGERLDRAIIVLMALALGYFAVDKFVLSKSREASIIEAVRQEARNSAVLESYGDKSIVVLPFVNMSGDPQQEYFSDGISEELLNLLAKIPELRVISRSSAFSFKGKSIATPEVAEQLNVAHVLEGSVRMSGSRVRITAQLIEAQTDSHLWSESYDRELTDILVVQDEIAAAISHALKVKLNLAAARESQVTGFGTSSFDIYSAYFRGRELISMRGRENLEEAVRELERVLRLKEDFASAHAHLAIAITLLVNDLSSYGTLSLAEVKRRATPHLERAGELDPNLPELHAARALLALKSNQFEFTAEEAQKALTLNPSYVDAMNWLHIALGALGRYQEADALLKRIVQLDPLTISGRINYIDWLSSVGRNDEAHEMADQLLVQSPASGYLAHADIAMIYEGKIAEGLSWALQTTSDSFYLLYGFLCMDEYDEARRINQTHTYLIDLAQGRIESAIEKTQLKLRDYPNDKDALFVAADVLFEAGRIEDALPLYERFNDEFPAGQPVAQPLSPIRFIRLAFSRRKAGNEEGARVVAEIFRKDIIALRKAGRNNQELHMAEAMMAAFDDDPDRVIAAIKSAIQGGMRTRTALDDPIFAAFQNDPRFMPLRRELDAILDSERGKALQLICFNNPAPGNWQPLPKTCEGVENQQDSTTS